MKDDFWDIDKLLPHKSHISDTNRVPPHPPTPPAPPVPPKPKFNIETKEISDGTSSEKSVSISDILTADLPAVKQNELDCSAKSRTVKSVILSDRAHTYFYDNGFYKATHKIHRLRPSSPAEFAPFFTYYPQYADMSKAQFDYYLWWRENVRGGNYLKVDTSYIFLYLYELLDLDDVIPPEDTLLAIVRLWSAYRESNPEINKYLFDWITDYALIHNIAVPFDELSRFLPYIKTKPQSLLYNMYFFDYVFADAEKLTYENIVSACTVLSNHNPFKGKHYADEEYKNAFEECLVPVFKSLFEIGLFNPDGVCLQRSELKVSHPLYLSAVCSTANQKNLTVIYYPYISNEIIRTAFSNVLKYTENKIRAFLGIKNRLSGIVLSDEIRNVIDTYIESRYPAAKKTNTPSTRDEIPHEIKKISVNLSRAKEIEDLSWQTTEKLTEGLEIEDDEAFVIPEPQNEPKQNDENHSLFDMLDDTEKAILKLMLENSAVEIEQTAREHGTMLDAVVDGINEKALECIGDTVINTADYTLISDYIDELSALKGDL